MVVFTLLFKCLGLASVFEMYVFECITKAVFNNTQFLFIIDNHVLLMMA